MARSLALTDCAKWLNGFGRGARYDGTYQADRPVDPVRGCRLESDYARWTPGYRQWLHQWGVAQMKAHENGLGWVFWTFKAERAPQWDYLLGRREGWVS